MRRALPFVSILLASAVAMAASPAGLLLPGEYRAGESGAQAGEQWLALVVDEERSALVATRSPGVSPRRRWRSCAGCRCCARATW
jgi:hypothetical protein